MRPWPVAFPLLVVIAACTKKPEPGSAASAASPPASTAPALAASSAPAPPSPSAAELSITNLSPGEFELEAATSTQLELQARLERQKPDGTWEPLAGLDHVAGYRLVEACEPGAIPPGPPDAGTCVELVAGKPFHPVPFQGMSCSAQCNHVCRANAWEGPGTFRLVVRKCGSDETINGPEFELPDAKHARGLPRWGAASDLASASIARLEPPSAGWDALAPKSPERVAGFSLRAGSERPLDAGALAKLGELLKSATAFDDDVLKRCAMQHLVGFRLTRRPATTGTPRDEAVELALDFNCQKLFLVKGGERGRPRTVHATHFDPARKDFLALVQGALPDDRELAKLR